MTQTLELNSSNDLFIDSGGSLTMLSGQDAVAAACETAAQTQLGECIYLTGFGLPNFGVLWTGVPDYGLWQSYLEQVLLNVEGVTAVNAVNITAQNSVLTYRAAITSIYSPQPILIQGSISSPS